MVCETSLYWSFWTPKLPQKCLRRRPWVSLSQISRTNPYNTCLLRLAFIFSLLQLLNVKKFSQQPCPRIFRNLTAKPTKWSQFGQTLYTGGSSLVLKVLFLFYQGKEASSLCWLLSGRKSRQGQATPSDVQLGLHFPRRYQKVNYCISLLPTPTFINVPVPIS